jgi:hypothetical protein
MRFPNAAAFVAHVDALVAKHDAREAHVGGGGDHIFREYSVKVAGDVVEADRVHIPFWIPLTTIPFLDDLIQLGDDEEAMRQFFLSNIGPNTQGFSIGYTPEGIEAYIEVSPPGPGHAFQIVSYDSGKREHNTYHEIRGRKPIAAVYQQYRATVPAEIYRALVAIVPPTACKNIYMHTHPKMAVSCQFAPANRITVHEALPKLAHLLYAASATPAALAVLDNVPPTSRLTWLGIYVPKAFMHATAKTVVKVYYVP